MLLLALSHRAKGVTRYMKSFFQPNIDRRGRIARGIIGAFLITTGVIIASCVLWWAGYILIVLGLFTLFEAISKWCLARACGIKTKL